ncbi:Trk system potassium transporter TrkA [Halomarina ordinaria]|uniref:Trk system potassium transporter TrkA n=1 Tax=Halomarina ordinaria TaxID=3033939 RepID=A0ABD5U8Q1_9EURY|nr:Trk system potassium transporter TrkA [Halomarina sp. PSRA2]
MRVIVIGAGEVGSSIADNLSGSHEVVVIDIDTERAESLTYELDVLSLAGDGTDIDVLEEAGVESADIVIASTDDDETNVVACGTAKAVSDAFTIARVKRPKYLRTWQRSEQAFNVDFMICTDLLTANAIVGVIGFPTAQDVDMFASGAVQMTEFKIPGDSPVANQTVAEADCFEELTFAAIIREDDIVIPTGQTRIEPGDEVVVIGNPESARAFSAAIAPRRNGPKDIVIVGGSEIGYQVARLLEERGFSPRLIERDADRARWIAEHLDDTLVLESDATDRDFLARERVGEADALVAALENDQQNLLATLLAKRIGTDRAVAVVDTADFADLFEAVGVDVAISPREVTAEEIIRFTHSQRTENVSMIEGDRAEVIEVEVDADSVLAGERISDAAARLPNVVFGAITRNGEFITPRGDTVVEPGDHVILFAETETVEEVADLV